MLNKKITIELAVGIVVLLALALGGVFLIQDKRINQENILNSSIVQNQNISSGQSQGGENLEAVKIYTDSWNTYQISQYGCKFKYPREWEPFSNLKSSPESDNFNVNNPKNKEERFSLFITTDKSYINNKNAVPSKKTIGGFPAMEYVSMANCDGDMSGGCPSIISLYVERDKYIYIISFGNGRTKKIEGVLDKILSTFEFTKYNVVEEETHWAK